MVVCSKKNKCFDNPLREKERPNTVALEPRYNPHARDLIAKELELFELTRGQRAYVYRRYEKRIEKLIDSVQKKFGDVAGDELHEDELFATLAHCFKSEMGYRYRFDYDSQFLAFCATHKEFTCMTGAVMIADVCYRIGKPVQVRKTPAHVGLIGEDFSFEITMELGSEVIPNYEIEHARHQYTHFPEDFCKLRSRAFIFERIPNRIDAYEFKTAEDLLFAKYEQNARGYMVNLMMYHALCLTEYPLNRAQWFKFGVAGLMCLCIIAEDFVETPVKYARSLIEKLPGGKTFCAEIENRIVPSDHLEENAAMFNLLLTVLEPRD